jgi:predicted ATP-binding protein involved in virulence
MKLTKIEIKGLFDLFDYDIPLTNEENLLIITGPNGFGKTMILNIIDSFFNNKLEFFQKLVFKSITILELNKKISIIKDSFKNVEISIDEDFKNIVSIGCTNR